jgi:hypothetical protein
MDARGNTTVTNFTVIRSGVTLAMETLTDEQLHQAAVSVNGTISASGYTVWINGVGAMMEGLNWTAANVPVPKGGMAVFALTAISLADNNGNGTAPAVLNANPALNNPTGTNAPMAAVETEKKPEVVRVNGHWGMEEWSLEDWTGNTGGWNFDWHCTETNQWADFGMWMNGLGGGSLDWHYTNSPAGYVVDSGTNRTTGTNGIFYSQTMTSVIWSAGYVGYWSATVPMPDWLKGSHGQAEITTDYIVKQTETADTRLIFRTGGRSGVKRQNLVEVSGTVMNRTSWDESKWVAVPPTNVSITGLKVNLGTDGKAYGVANDNEEVDITPIAPVGYYSFNGFGAVKHTLEMNFGGNDITDSNVTVVVGQLINPSCRWKDGAGPTITNFQWTVPGYAISNYIPTWESAVVYESFPKTNETVRFYWKDPAIAGVIFFL